MFDSVSRKLLLFNKTAKKHDVTLTVTSFTANISEPAICYLAMIRQIDHRDETENLVLIRVLLREISRKKERGRLKHSTVYPSRLNASMLSLGDLLGMSSPPLFGPSLLE